MGRDASATRAHARFYSNNYGALLGMTRVWVWVRSPASTLRKICSKSLKHRTREEGAGKGEFAFTECRNFYLVLAQNRGFCAKEEPQAIEQTSRVYSAFCEVSLAATRRAARHDMGGERWCAAPSGRACHFDRSEAERRNLPGYVSDTLIPQYSVHITNGSL